MRKEELKDWTREQLEIALVYADDCVNNYSKIMAENAQLQTENRHLRQQIEKIENKNNNDSIINYDKLIRELQDQYQQDCIRINDLRTSYLVTVDELARLREQFGVGR